MNNIMIMATTTTDPLLMIVPGIVIVIAIGVGLILNQNGNRKRALQINEQLIAEAKAWLASVKESGLLPVKASIILKADEYAFYEAPSALYETRAVRYSTGGGVGFRVAKGVYVGGGGARSLSEQEWNQVDAGTLTVTNKRLVFNGGKADRVVPLTKIVSANAVSLSQVEVSAEGRQKSMMFDGANPVILSTIFDFLCKGNIEPITTQQESSSSNNEPPSREQLQSWWKKLHGTDHCVLS
jgi:hypothetical protein